MMTGLVHIEPTLLLCNELFLMNENLTCCVCIVFILLIDLCFA
jgi:hypothetical protein